MTEEKPDAQRGSHLMWSLSVCLRQLRRQEQTHGDWGAAAIGVCFPRFWGLGSPRSRCRQNRVLVRALVLACRRLPSRCVLTGPRVCACVCVCLCERERGAVVGTAIQGSDPQGMSPGPAGMANPPWACQEPEFWSSLTPSRTLGVAPSSL